MDEKGRLFNESLQKIQLPFRLSGLPLYSTEKFTFKLRILSFLHLFFLSSGALGAFHVCWVKAMAGEDFVTVTVMAPCMCFSSLAGFKALHLILNRSKICEIIDKLFAIEEETKNYIVDDIYNKERNSLHKVITYFKAVYIVLLIAFMISPFSIMAKNYFEGDFELVYPFTLSYPFDINHLELYPAVYLHQVECTIAVFLFAGAADSFFYTCCLYISIQFKMLQLQFEILIPDDRSQIRLKFEDVKDKFVELVEWHEKLISLTNLLEVVYGKITLYNFVISSVLICLTLFDVTVIKDVSLALTFLFFLTTCFVQISLLCYFGDKVTQASTEVSDAVYNSLWYKCDISVGKHLLIVLMRSQKPCKLTALGFADVNQRSFMRIMSNAWSYFALLKTMYH
ncbi:putative odorant receptor 92a [Plodia interpunctella]|uniref:putative odorant receptor 92a n=1 Tax=Plodia interpunctella TaxID=58824 RepID=UPI002367BB39|nr:putative odorant receptor 92a [Plodia interpunctella]